MKAIVTGAAALALFSFPALADGIDGTWKADLGSTKLPKKPDVYVVGGGNFSCKTCTPAFNIKADGKDQAVKGSPYFDSAAVTLGDHKVTEVDKKGGKTVTTTETVIAADGKSATQSFTDTSASTTPVTGKVMLTRAAPGAKGSHPMSGSWHVASYSGISDNGLTITYKSGGGMLSMSTPAGQSYSAKLDGTPAPYKGDPGTDMVSVKMAGKSVVETDMRGGKPIAVYTTTPSADGKSLSIKSENKLKGTSMIFTAKKM
ncbi:MAG: hypothetical protein JO256_15355 [Alphaproteobacteria bacterium]|nr:hypothetical protein [Alphaproteobacteria bacterium]